MTFLAIIIALVLLQVWGSGDRVQHDDWFFSWRARVDTWDGGEKIKLALAVLVPAFLLYFVLDLLSGVLFGLLWIALTVLVLLYSFGRRDFHELMARYQVQCRGGNFEGAYLSTLSELGWVQADDDPVSPQQVHMLAQRGFLYEGYQRWFAVLFYCLLLGPAAALAYRLLQLCRDDFEPGLSARCLYVVDWLPARLLAAAFAVTGDFVGSRDKLFDASAEASELLYAVGMAALGSAAAPSTDGPAFGEEAAMQNREVGSLLSRSAACWLAAISLLVLLA